MKSAFFRNFGRYILLSLVLLTSNYASASDGISTSTNNYSNIFLFGDSLSDTGNIATVTGSLPLPFYNNRASNGEVGIDELVKSLNAGTFQSTILNANYSDHLINLATGTGSNYAVVGARAGGMGANDLSAQVTAFFTRYNGVAPNSALYIVFIGGNDVIFASGIFDPSLAHQTIDTAVAIEKLQIQKLITAGAQHILVINVINVSLAPIITIQAATSPVPQHVLQAYNLSLYFNMQLNQSVLDLNMFNNSSIIYFDLFTAFDTILMNASLPNGFSNTTDACYNTTTYMYYAGCSANLFQDYIYFDELHPTAKVHKLLADEILHVIP